ncbi:glycosyltransferase [Nocardia seriolae]|uniref:glycosyltransferase family 2 protein n=1 Tax=Nocardia seriolae TaxID=37332 RepID=UPI0012BCC25A|nr:glycosyltransferase family 2 protein [Nocardia seriolae]MTL12219.1 glycosyltransferase [Nocardia seriolae]
MNSTEHVAVAIVIVTYNSATDIPLLLADLRAEARGIALRIVVVDNESADGTAEVVRGYPEVVFVASGGNLGYAGGINVGLGHIGSCDAVLILNPDLRVRPGAIARMVATLDADDRIGAVVPLILNNEGHPHPSLSREPSVTRAFGDALLGSKLWRDRPEWLSEFDYRPSSYEQAHDVDWATGACLLIRGSLAVALGEWNESFFLYSEETEYFRRIRSSGHTVRFDPTAVVQHRLGGSGTSPALATLLEVNRIRYVELHHTRWYATLFRAMVALAAGLRGYDADHRRTLSIVLNRHRWNTLPRATKPAVPETLSGPFGRGAVIVPAYNESAVIERTLRPLGAAAVAGYFELIVVANGCTDDTAARARTIPGVHVVELPTGSKPLALNTGDSIATSWPRLYLDADIQITATTILALLDRIDRGDILAARPTFRYDSATATPLVRGYYRARRKMAAHQNALWWAGVFGLSAEAHKRFGEFPDVTGDDMFVDTQFDDTEKTVVETDPSVWTTPTTLPGLLTVLTRHHRGNTELRERDPHRTPNTTQTTARAILRTITGPRSALDAAIYLGIAIAARRRAAHSDSRWERDDTSRTS